METSFTDRLQKHVRKLRQQLFEYTGTGHYIESSDMGKVDSLRAKVTEYVLEHGLLVDISLLNGNLIGGDMSCDEAASSFSGDIQELVRKYYLSEATEDWTHNLIEADYIQAELRLFWLYLLEGEEKESN